MKIAIVTGGSSGIGLATVNALLDENDIKVYEFSRREHFEPQFTEPGVAERFVHVKADVTDEAGVQDAVDLVYSSEGRIDILINCAGSGISGAVEYTLSEAAKRQFDVNFFGMVNVNKAVLPYMRQAGNGRIVNISSVAAVAPIPFQTYYSASKAAINSYTCALDNEIRPFNISVTAIMPGDISTGFTAARAKSNAGDEAYMGRISKSVAKMEQDEINGMKPEKAGKYIARIALKKNVKPLYSIGFTYKFLSVLCTILPVRLRNGLIGKLYG